MTSFLTFAVTGVRISSDIPVQSMYLQLINLYILLYIIYTLLGFIWFIIADQLSKRKYLPFFLVKIAFIVKKVLYWIFKENPNRFEEDKKNEQNNDEIKLNVSALNYLAFFILFIIVFSCNLAIWIVMDSN